MFFSIHRERRSDINIPLHCPKTASFIRTKDSSLLMCISINFQLFGIVCTVFWIFCKLRNNPIAFTQIALNQLSSPYPPIVVRTLGLTHQPFSQRYLFLKPTYVVFKIICIHQCRFLNRTSRTNLRKYWWMRPIVCLFFLFALCYALVACTLECDGLSEISPQRSQSV